VTWTAPPVMRIVSARAAVAQQRHATKTIKSIVFLMIGPSSRALPSGAVCNAIATYALAPCAATKHRDVGGYVQGEVRPGFCGRGLHVVKHGCWPAAVRVWTKLPVMKPDALPRAVAFGYCVAHGSVPRLRIGELGNVTAPTAMTRRDRFVPLKLGI
jgi:hypothetical protein